VHLVLPAPKVQLVILDKASPVLLVLPVFQDLQVLSLAKLFQVPLVLRELVFQVLLVLPVLLEVSVHVLKF